MANSTIYNFFLADGWRITIIILIIIATILFLFVLIKTLSKSKKYTLVYKVMLNVMITAILNAVVLILNWVIYDDNNNDNKITSDENNNGTLLFGNETDFLCQFQAGSISATVTARETFVTLISVLSFISFKFGEDLYLYKSKLGLILVLFIGYLIPIIGNIIYYFTGSFGKTQYFCFIKNKLLVTIHLSYMLFLLIISIIFITYLIIKTSCHKIETEYEGWINDKAEKNCINPILKKIIFFPIAQVFTNCLTLTFRFVDHYIGSKDYSKLLARPAALVNSVSSILYTLVFAITNGIFTNFGEKKGDEQEEIKNTNNSESIVYRLVDL